MPFDFAKYKHYSINYTSLFNVLNSYNIISDKNLQAQYLKSWMSTLINSDNIITNELKTQESILRLQKLLQTERQIFRFPLNHQNNEIILNFRASIANQTISDHKMKGSFVPLDNFVLKNSIINWTPVDTNVDSYSNSKEPIIMVPFLNGKDTFLVIDGNHRITYKTKHNINDIQAMIFSEKSVIDFDLFSSEFDKLYYIMHNELNHMSKETHNKMEDPNQLVQKSYLNGGKFKFSDSEL